MRIGMQITTKMGVEMLITTTTWATIKKLLISVRNEPQSLESVAKKCKKNTNVYNL
jgi:hypothetical protein